MVLLPSVRLLVHVEVAADIFECDQCRELVISGGLDLAAVFAQLRRYIIKLQVAIDIWLVGTADAFASGAFSRSSGFTPFGKR